MCDGWGKFISSAAASELELRLFCEISNFKTFTFLNRKFISSSAASDIELKPKFPRQSNVDSRLAYEVTEKEARSAEQVGRCSGVFTSHKFWSVGLSIVTSQLIFHTQSAFQEF